MGTFALFLAAFLIGSIPSGVILSRSIGRGDVRMQGSGNIGAANVARTSGFRVGAAVGLGDILKGVVPVVVASATGLSAGTVATTAVCAVLGHDYSVFLRFRGGKGVATTLGVALGLAVPAGAIAALTWVIIMLACRYSSVASIGALVALPIALAITGQPQVYVVAGIFLMLLGIWKHRDNILRLARGEERRFGRSRDSRAG